MRYGGVIVRCSGGVGLVKYGRGCARVGAWVWLWAGDGVLQLRFKRVSADHIYANAGAKVRRGWCVTVAA